MSSNATICGGRSVTSGVALHLIEQEFVVARRDEARVEVDEMDAVVPLVPAQDGEVVAVGGYVWHTAGPFNRRKLEWCGRVPRTPVLTLQIELPVAAIGHAVESTGPAREIT